MEKAWGLKEGNAAQKRRHRQQTLLAEQGPELVDGAEERHEVDASQRPLEQQPRQPVPHLLPNTRRSAARAA